MVLNKVLLLLYQLC